jgi:hypothetical protein
MDDDTAARAAARTGLGALAVSCVFGLIVGGIAGIITTFTHAQLPPWGLVAGLAIAAALALGFRLVFDSRLVGTAAAVGFVAASAVLALPGAGAPILTLDGPSGWIWAIGPTLLAVAALLPRWPGAVARRS